MNLPRFLYFRPVFLATRGYWVCEGLWWTAIGRSKGQCEENARLIERELANV